MCHSGCAAILILFTLAFVSSPVGAQQPPPERTIEEIKAEALSRAEHNGYPVIGIDPADLREAFVSIHTREKDEWATAFIKVADRYMAEGKALEKTDREKTDASYVRAWHLYSFGRWPVPSSPGKQRAYEKSIEAFLAHASFWDPPLEIVRIPFEGSQIIGYLRLPKNAGAPVPLVIAINGLDSRKEDLSESFGAILPYGIGFLAVDGPGTGQAPIKASENAERMFSRVLDYLQTRPEIDKTRIAVHGVSWGAYWGTKLSVIERTRLKAVSAQSPPTDVFFQKDFLMNSLLGNREYLFDQVPALMAIFDNIHTPDELAAFFPRMSLVKLQILGKPTTPMHVLAGVLDTQVPISDIYLLLDKGSVPKEAWINPEGGHLGRQRDVWPDPRIFNQVIIPWLVSSLNGPPHQSSLSATPP